MTNKRRLLRGFSVCLSVLIALFCAFTLYHSWAYTFPSSILSVMFFLAITPYGPIRAGLALALDRTKKYLPRFLTSLFVWGLLCLGYHFLRLYLLTQEPPPHWAPPTLLISPLLISLCLYSFRWLNSFFAAETPGEEPPINKLRLPHWLPVCISLFLIFSTIFIYIYDLGFLLSVWIGVFILAIFPYGPVWTGYILFLDGTRKHLQRFWISFLSWAALSICYRLLSPYLISRWFAHPFYPPVSIPLFLPISFLLLYGFWQSRIFVHDREKVRRSVPQRIKRGFFWAGIVLCFGLIVLLVPTFFRLIEEPFAVSYLFLTLGLFLMAFTLYNELTDSRSKKVLLALSLWAAAFVISCFLWK